MADTWTTNDTNNVSGGKHIAVGSSMEKEEISRLEQKIVDVQSNYLNYVEKNLQYDKNVSEQNEKSSAMTRFYCLAVAGLCLAPLRKGVNAKTVMKTIGLWACCSFLSKTFREETNQVVSDVLAPLVKKKAANAGENSIWQKRKEQLNNGEFPLTPESAALMKIAFCKQAYADMHKDGANVNQILSKYREAEQQLYVEAQKAGIKPEVLDKSMRTIVGNLVERDPEFVKVFNETAYDYVSRGEDTVYTQKYQASDGVKERSYSKWEGNYTDISGNNFTQAFTPREPETVNHLRRLSSDAWFLQMNKAHTPEEWGEAVSSDDIRHKQQKYLSLMMEDNGLSPDELSDLNSVMNPDDDVTWMLDVDGDDPFGVGSLDDSFVDLIENGPKPDAQTFDVGEYPEFKAAYSKWLNHHPEMSPMAQQKQANQTYYEYVARGKKDKDLLDKIYDFMQTRNMLQSRWDKVFAKVNANVNEKSPRGGGGRKQRALPGEKQSESIDLNAVRHL